MRPRRRSTFWLGGALLFLAATPAWAAAAAPDACELNVVAATHTLPPYPKAAQASGEQGTTRLLVTIDRAGVPTKIVTDKSAGFALLDTAAADWVKLKWRWKPVGKSCPAANTLVDIVWDISAGPDQDSLVLDADDADYPADARAKGEEGEVALDIQLSQDGVILQSRVSQSSGSAALDAKAIQIALRHSFQTARVDGQPVLSSLRLFIAFRLSTTGPAAIPASP